jgi:hypothetical protein
MQSGEPTTISYQPWGGTNRYNGYIAEAIMLDGTASAVSNFVDTDDNGNPIPVDPSGLTFGTNGFWLNFADSADLGNDVSGNNNDFTPTSITSANATSDNPADDATNDKGNHATWNPLSKDSTVTLSNGNLTMVGTSGATADRCDCTQQIPSTGKWYWEVTIDATSGVYPAIGFGHIVSNNFNNYPDQTNTDAVSIHADGDTYYYNNTLNNAYASLSATNVVQIAIDMDTGKVWFGVNNTWLSGGDPAAGTTPEYTITANRADLVPQITGYNNSGGTADFGQNGFTYTPPTGFKALNTANLPEPATAASVTPITGSFTGNASADGPFVWLGYTPADDTQEDLTGGTATNPGAALHSFSGTGVLDDDTAQDGFYLTGDEAGETVDIDLGDGNDIAVTGVGWIVENDGANNQSAVWSLFYSDNGSDWTDTTQNITITDDGTAMREHFQYITGQTAHRYWRLSIDSTTATGNGWYSGVRFYTGTNAPSFINNNRITWGTHADALAGGLKLRTASSSYNASGSNSYSIAVDYPFGGSGYSQAKAR